MSTQLCISVTYTIPGKELTFNSENHEEGAFVVNVTTNRVDVLASGTGVGRLSSIPQPSSGSYPLKMRKGLKTNYEIRKAALSELLILK